MSSRSSFYIDNYCWSFHPAFPAHQRTIITGPPNCTLNTSPSISPLDEINCGKEPLNIRLPALPFALGAPSALVVGSRGGEVLEEEAAVEVDDAFARIPPPLGCCTTKCKVIPLFIPG